jgi:hypothetical protein
MLMPSIGFCGTPFTSRGSGIPATSRIVGAMSMQWWNCERMPPRSAMPLGHDMTRPLRVPPKCDATCFIHWNGDEPAQHQPTG